MSIQAPRPTRPITEGQPVNIIVYQHPLAERGHRAPDSITLLEGWQGGLVSFQLRDDERERLQYTAPHAYALMTKVALDGLVTLVTFTVYSYNEHTERNERCGEVVRRSDPEGSP